MNRENLINNLSIQIRKEITTYSSKIKIDSEKKIFPAKNSLSQLKKEFGREKEIPKEFESSILYALSFYPELKSIKISFLIKPALFAMETQIKLASLFFGKRHYVINIKKKYVLIFLNNFSAVGLAGLIGHELGHVVDYERRSKLKMAKFAFNYLFPISRRRIELANDLRQFYHGMGNAMIIYEREYMNSPFSEREKKYHNSFYLRREELEKLGKKNNLKKIRNK